MNSEKQLLLMMLGPPGAGKSYFARNVAEELGMTRVTADEVRTRLFGSIEAARTPERKLVVYQTVNQEMEVAIYRGESVVRDNQNNHRADRDMCRALAQEVSAQAIIVWIRTPQSIAVQRCMTRPASDDQIKLNEPMAQDFYTRSMRAIERPAADEVCIQIDGTLGFSDQFTIFKDFLTSIEK